MSLKLTPLPLETIAATGFTHKARFTWADLITLSGASGTSVTLPLFPITGTMPAGTVVRCAGMQLVTAFDASDAAINSLLVEVGDGVDTDRFLPQTQVAIDGTEILWFVTSNATATLPYAYLAADGIDAKFTVAGGGTPTIAELTSGEIELYIGMYNMNDLLKA